jgi:hypothetical protein
MVDLNILITFFCLIY